MIDINRETGTVTWDSFTLHPHLTHDEFVQRYPEIKCSRYYYKYSHIRGKLYRFPETKIDDYLLIPEITYDYDRLPGISFDMPDTYYDEYLGDESMNDLRNRSKSIRELLITSLGQPQRYNPYCFGFFDEVRKLSSEEIEALQGWEYQTEWGGVQTYCFYEQGQVLMGLSIGYRPAIYT